MDYMFSDIIESDITENEKKIAIENFIILFSKMLK